MKNQIMLHTILMTGLLLPFAASALTIDDFETDQTAIGPMQATNESSATQSAGNILGFERDLHISTGASSTSTARVLAGRFLLQNDSQSNSLVTMQWDGADNSSTINTNGLGGVDLTEGDATDAFEIRFLFDDLPATLQLTVWSGSESSTVSWPSPAALLTAELSIFIPFSAFTANPNDGTGAGADFTSAGAIQLAIEGLFNGADIEIDYIQTVQAPVPVPPAVWLFASALMGLGLRRRNA